MILEDIGIKREVSQKGIVCELVEIINKGREKHRLYKWGKRGMNIEMVYFLYSFIFVCFSGLFE